MLNAPARLLRLLALLQARSEWTGRELAERLETTARTLRRDVERLRSLGYEVHSSPGAEGGYRLGTGTAMPPLALEDDEAIAIALSLATSSGTGVSGIADASMRAAAKLERTLPHGLRQRLTSVRASVVPLQGGGPVVGMGMVSIAAQACVARNELQFSYRDHGGMQSVRTVEPHGLVSSEGHWYLVAWDKEREAWRTFRLDRASALLTTQRHFAGRRLPEEGIATYVSRGLAVAPYRFRARIIVHAPAETVRETMSPAAGVVEPIDSHRCRVETGASSLGVLAAWLGCLLLDFEVEEPPELVDQMKLVAKRLELAASRATSSGVAEQPKTGNTEDR
jgi:predicted DNA-binding transcriptional regulator YafY